MVDCGVLDGDALASMGKSHWHASQYSSAAAGPCQELLAILVNLPPASRLKMYNEKVADPIGNYLSSRQLVIEPIIGWRAWEIGLSYERLVLLSPTSRGFIWNPGQVMLAYCEHNAVERQTCMCGFNCYRSRELLLGTPYESTRSGRKIAIGGVSLSGEVIEYELGYRAQRAQVVGPLTIKGGQGFSQELLDGLAADYGVEVINGQAARGTPVAKWLGREAEYMQLSEEALKLTDELALEARNLALAEDIVERQRGDRPASIQHADAEVDELISALLHCVHDLQLPPQWIEQLLNQGLGLETPYTYEQMAQSAAAQGLFMDRSLAIVAKALHRSKLVREAAETLGMWAVEASGL